MRKTGLADIINRIAVFAAVFAVICVWISGACMFAEGETAVEDRKFDEFFANDKVVVVMNDDAENIVTYTVADFPEIECAEVTDLTRALKDTMRKGDKRSENSGIFKRDNFRSILRITLKNGGEQSISAAVQSLEKRSDIISVQCDPVMQPQSTPNDTYYASGEQWGLNGENGIHAEDAWAITTGSPDVKIGVIDSGIDATHPDLTNRVNRDYWADYSIYDDLDFDYGDSAPFVDVIPGGHGTHVAGIIGAQGNNESGIVGVDRSADLISLKVSLSNKEENYYGSQLISAVSYAIANGINVLNNSNFCDFYKYGDYKSCIESFDWILYNYGGLFVTAAGNAGKDMDNFPYGFPAVAVNADNMIVVGAIDRNGKIWYNGSYGSNYGDKVDIYAPGADIISTVPTANGEAAYASKSGTSMAAPHMAGVAALMLSVNSRLTGRDLKNIILNNCDTVKIKLPNGKESVVKKLNAYKAVKAAQTYSI